MEKPIKLEARDSIESIRVFGGGFLDENNIDWKFVNGICTGKRSVWTFDRRACWLEETTVDNVKSWWCGEDADYNEIFKYTKPIRVIMENSYKLENLDFKVALRVRELFQPKKPFSFHVENNIASIEASDMEEFLKFQELYETLLKVK